jgi:hypothetical protein
VSFYLGVGGCTVNQFGLQGVRITEVPLYIRVETISSVSSNPGQASSRYITGKHSTVGRKLPGMQDNFCVPEFCVAEVNVTNRPTSCTNGTHRTG